MKRTVEDLQQFKQAFVEKTSIPCMQIDLIDEVPGIMDDKFGGRPFLPVGESIPMTSEGELMSLLLQVNLKHIDLEGWPKSGILEIWFDTIGTYPNEYAVRIFNEFLPYQPTEDMTADIFDHAFSLHLTKTTTIMPMSDFRFATTVAELIKEQYGETVMKYQDEYTWGTIDQYMDEHFDLGTKLVRGVKKAISWLDDWDFKIPQLTFGGYADFTQNDVREYEAPSTYTACLFKIDSCYDIGQIDLGDAGIMIGIIDPYDLQDSKFDKAFMSWDCC